MFCGWIISSRVICSSLVMNISESVSYLLLAKAMNSAVIALFVIISH